jgi:hypothetical protein
MLFCKYFTSLNFQTYPSSPVSYSVFSYFLSRLSMEMFITALQVLVQILITYFLIDFQSGFAIFWSNCYTLAMSSTALAVLLGTSALFKPGHYLVLTFL